VIVSGGKGFSMDDMGVGGVRDGHGEKVFESLRLAHYDYKNLLGGMMRKFSWMLLVLLVLGCGEEVTKEEEKPEAVVETEPPPPDKITWEKDGKEMALIPAGNFMMGDRKGTGTGSRPVHTVTLDAFYMDVHEVTVGQFKQFVEQSGYNYGGNWDSVAKYSPGDEYPIVLVNWNDATAYAKWAGKRLPTEAEWEYAARGRLVGKRYPGGDEITHDDANYRGTDGKDKWIGIAPVGSFEANGYGLYDMAGNVWEWCQDWYGEEYYNDSPTKNPPGSSTGSHRVLRGGGWNSFANDLRVALRNSYDPADWVIAYGFRCVSGSN